MASGTTDRKAARHRRGSCEAALGFRHVSLVRAVRRDDRTRFEVEGVVHRHPVTRPVAPALAARLVAAGVPLVSHRSDAGVQAWSADPDA